MKTFIIKNAEGIILGSLILTLIGAVVFNILTHGIVNTASFEF